ncbi:M10 family metallopeptidase C-terminal domain-containing protein [Proteus sp. FME41]|uniref:M10 family metallopeptidase C-terminal domain-containing protein n=1 Tax=Proteus sp. FME41 TaxID=2742608 RepID=UPI0018681C92|nr:M10 family metallopeptidase C-terminal domain-containing protein [Proteus sp. FME41]
MTKHEISPGISTIIDVIKNKSPLKRWSKINKEDIFTEITYSFPNWSILRSDEYKTITTLNNHQQNLAEKTLQQWSDITNIKFIKKDNKYDTNIKFGAYNNVNEITKDTSHLVSGVATFPINKTKENKEINKITDYSDGGHIWINLSSTVRIKKFNKNEITEEQKNKVNLFKEKADNIKYYFIETDTHITLYKNINENAHINNQSKVLEKGNGETFVFIHEAAHALGLLHTFRDNPNNPNIEENSLKYSVMAYRAPKIEDADFNGYFPMSPLLIDIYVIQKFYGVNITTRIDDTIYGFDSNTQRDYYSLTSPEDIMISCIWDAGGIDTLDFSKYNVNQKIELNEGAFSDIGGLRSNISIAYGSIIENALGGSGNDIISGNNVDNHLYGNDGNDIIYGHNGNDILYGGKGGDLLCGGEGNDTLYGSDGYDILWAGNGNNQLNGGNGRDLFIFTLNDTYNNHNKIMDFNKDEDFIFFADNNNIIINLKNSINKDEISLSSNYNSINNMTKIFIKNEIKPEKTYHTIDIIGNLTLEDIFNF